MTKLEQLLNKYYSTEELTLREHLYEIREDQEHYEVVDELVNLLHWLNEEL